MPCTCGCQYEDEWFAREFVFINISKTANTSIRRGLRIQTNKHLWVDKVIDRIGIDAWNELYTFTFVRNPWDRIVSHYHFMAQHEPHELFVHFPKERIPVGRPKLPFKEWVRFVYQDEPELYHMKYRPCVDWYMRDGVQMVDFVGRFENLEADYAHVCRMIGRTSRGSLTQHRNKSEHRHYRDYYDSETAAIIAQVFAEDIELLGYSF